MIHVVQVVSDTNVGGAGRYLLNYLKYYDRSQFAVTVILPESSMLQPLAEPLCEHIVQVPYMGDRSFDRRCVRHLTGVLRSLKPDILHTHASLSARIAGRRAHVPCIISSRHCMEPVGHGPKAKLKGILNNRLSDVFIGVANAVGQNLIDCGVSPRKVRVVYNGVQPVEALGTAERDVVRAELGFSPEHVVFGIVARVEPVKGHQFFVEAAARMQSPNARFLVVGDGSLLADVKAQAHALGLDGRMVFTGYLPDTRKVTNALDVNVISSYSEAMSLAVLEAMSLGKPSVVTDTGGNPELVTDGDNGFLVPVGDSNALAAAMDRLTSDHALYAQMAAAAKARFEAGFTARRMVETLETLYREAASRG